MQPLRHEEFEKAIRRADQQPRRERLGRHAVLAFVAAAAFALAAVVLIRGGLEARNRVAAEDDPVTIAEQGLVQTFNQDVAKREIQAALEASDVDLAQSFLDLARERNVMVDPALAEKVKAASAEAASATSTAKRFVRGFWTGEPNDVASLAGTAVGDLFVFGDIRDATREGVRLARGQEADKLILGLACVGIAITAGTYASLGTGAPARLGLTLVKAARSTGRLSARLATWIGRSLRDAVDVGPLARAFGLSDPALAVNVAREAVKVEKAGGLMELIGNVGRVERKAGTQAALDSLKVAEGPRDMSRLARLAEASGSKTRAIVKLLGRAAIIATAGALSVASWFFWTAVAVFGFVSSLKKMVERLTLAHIYRRKARRIKEAELRLAFAAAASPLLRQPDWIGAKAAEARAAAA
jgi:hypothetical protein